MFAAELDAKRLELLATPLPNARRIPVLNPGLCSTSQSLEKRLRLDEVGGATIRVPVRVPFGFHGGWASDVNAASLLA
jgi:hypothetical protein